MIKTVDNITMNWPDTERAIEEFRAVVERARPGADLDEAICLASRRAMQFYVFERKLHEIEYLHNAESASDLRAKYASELLRCFEQALKIMRLDSEFRVSVLDKLHRLQLSFPSEFRRDAEDDGQPDSEGRIL